MRNILTNAKPDLLIEMQDESTYADTFDFLKSVNYNMFWFPVPTYNPNNHKQNKQDIASINFFIEIYYKKYLS